MCMNCSKGCSQCSLSFNGLYYITCSQCSQGYLLNNGICNPSGSCSANCLTCDSNSICTQCQPFYLLSNGNCIGKIKINKESCASGQAIMMQNFSSACLTQSQVGCGTECLKCASDGSCIVCQPGYVLLVNPISVTCRKKNLFFTCKSLTYAYSADLSVCYSNSTDSISKMSACAIVNCLICHPNIPNICLLCKNQLLLQ